MAPARHPAWAVRCASAALLLAGLSPRPAAAWTAQEHRLLADRALSVALAGLGGDSLLARRAADDAAAYGAAGPPGTEGFGGMCARGARDDRSPARYHRRDRTLLEELSGLPAPRLDAIWHRVERRVPALLTGAGASPRRLPAANVVAGYLEHHLMALRLARLAGATDAPGAPALAAVKPGGDAFDRLAEAFAYEALAQGFLADAFAAGHLMPPAGPRLAGLHPINRDRLHDSYSINGVYVLDARGEAWQTFGDRLLLWYGPSFAHVFEACTTSLRELLLTWHMAAGGARPSPLAVWADSLARAAGTTREKLVEGWCSSRDGPAYLTEVRLPTLMLIPTPIAATWSVRTAEDDGHGLRRRHHYPQIADAGGHDPSLDARDIARLPRRAAVPVWMIPDTLFRADPLALIRRHRDFASARYVQPREPRPSYTGLLISAGGIRYDDASGGGTDRILGLGFSPAGETALLLHRFSVDGQWLSPVRGGGRSSAAFMLGANLKLPGLGIWRDWPLHGLEYVRFSAGHAWTRDASRFIDGPRYALGIEGPVIPLRFTMAAVTLRLEGQWTRLGRPRRGLALQIVMQ